jgi:phosphoribosylformylglycinamidine cyclo-ligase
VALRDSGASDARAYASAGVDIHAADAVKRRIAELISATLDERTLGVGSFGSMFRLGSCKDPVLVSSCDGVGTKLKIAALMNNHRTVGRDIVNHCINDILCCGAMPLFFLDYIAAARLNPQRTADVVAGLSDACRDAGMALVGGETAEMPGFYTEGVYDLVGFVVGVVERDSIIDGSAIREGDVLVGLPSAGLHTNGYSLARRVFGIDENPAVLSRRPQGLNRTLGEALLEPHRPYHRLLSPFLGLAHGIAHITGGGFQGNIPRVLPSSLAARIDTASWTAPALFELIQSTGDISRDEMYRVFNMGIGLVVVTSPDGAARLAASIPDVYSIGEVVARQGEEQVILN